MSDESINIHGKYPERFEIFLAAPSSNFAYTPQKMLKIPTIHLKTDFLCHIIFLEVFRRYNFIFTQRLSLTITCHINLLIHINPKS